jgi:hypothetical protein
MAPPQRQYSGHSDDSNLTYGSSAASSPDLRAISEDQLAHLGTPITPPLENAVADSFVFAFDIDGVLVRGGRAIPEAVEAMRFLNGANPYGIQM